ncbi:MAG: ABC transporter permease, partial [Burkholderiaceae bacterium]|nr:ABC transporter permease [Burkholderiaceae bacterium]
MSSTLNATIEAPDIKAAKPGVLKRLLRNPSVLIGGALMLLIALMGLCAPLLTAIDPAEIDPSNRNMMPGHESTVRDDDGNKIQRVALMGTDSLGRDIYSRVVWGARVSLTVGIAVAVLSVAIGLVIGLVAGYFRALDGVIMRIMDGLMAVPAILVAIALVSLSGASLLTVIIAVAIP